MKSGIILSDDDILKIGTDSLSHLDEKKALDPVCIDLRDINGCFDFFLIATGNSKTHCTALAKDITKFLHEKGLKAYGRPDLNSEWIVLDFGSLIVHIFTEEMREYYQLEKLWGDAQKININ
ncbi:MAG: ribosome silencing factor [Leptospirales bacterium]|nr:ribosome silencing factor [Leptospirales bacterium]